MAYILSKIPILYRTVLYRNASFELAKMMLMRNCHLTRTNIREEQRFKLKDNISNDYKLIYREQEMINFTMIVAYNCGWLYLVYSVITIGYVIYKNPPLRQDAMKDRFGKEIMKPSKLGLIIILSVGIMLSISFITLSKIVPFRIYHNPTKKLYKAIFVSNVLGKAKILTFGEGTVVPKFKYLEDVFDINGYTSLLDEECFLVPYVREQMIRKTV